MKRIIIPLITWFLITAFDGRAQDSIKLSLPEAIKFGLANNKTIQAKELDREFNHDKKGELSSIIYPSINGNFGINQYINVPVQYARANTFDPTAPADQYIGVKLLLPSSANVGLSANWLLYNQAIYSGLKLVKAQSELSDIQTQKDKSELAYSISQLYYGILFAQRQKEIILRIDSNIIQLTNILQSNYDNGLIKKSEVDKVMVNRVSTESQIEELNSAIETQNSLLRLIIGLSANANIKLTDTDVESALTPVTETSVSSQNTFDFQIMQSQTRLNKLGRKIIWAGYLPSLSLSYSYSYNWVSPEFDKLFSSGFKYPQQYIGINLSVPIFDGNKNLYQLKENKVTARQLDLRAQFLSEKISTDITNAQLSYNASLKNVGSNAKNVKLGENLYAQSMLEYQQGTISLNDVLTFETSLQQAQTEYFRSVSNALMALLEYKKATNTILNK